VVKDPRGSQGSQRSLVDYSVLIMLDDLFYRLDHALFEVVVDTAHPNEGDVDGVGACEERDLPHQI